MRARLAGSNRLLGFFAKPTFAFELISYRRQLRRAAQKGPLRVRRTTYQRQYRRDQNPGEKRDPLQIELGEIDGKNQYRRGSDDSNR